MVATLWMLGPPDTVRQRLRAWVRQGANWTTPHPQPFDVTACFAPLRRWIIRCWQGEPRLVLARDATARGDRRLALVVSVV